KVVAHVCYCEYVKERNVYTSTCCLIDIGTYGCCPMMDAVCCDDRTHCCPPNTKCDMEHRQCLQVLNFLRFSGYVILKSPIRISM
uniref:GRANULINS domain-containing protein n=1 Tax=Elaeophora elaphi TaxID=1147741 RepID=A0A0R3RHD6_9BILA